jgi:hypothetical protein
VPAVPHTSLQHIPKPMGHSTVHLLRLWASWPSHPHACRIPTSSSCCLTIHLRARWCCTRTLLRHSGRAACACRWWRASWQREAEPVDKEKRKQEQVKARESGGGHGTFRDPHRSPVALVFHRHARALCWRRTPCGRGLRCGGQRCCWWSSPTRDSDERRVLVVAIVCFGCPARTCVPAAVE